MKVNVPVLLFANTFFDQAYQGQIERMGGEFDLNRIKLYKLHGKGSTFARASLSFPSLLRRQERRFAEDDTRRIDASAKRG